MIAVVAVVAVVALASLALGGLVSLAGLTAIGARRRGRGIPAALVAGLFFPATWVAWHVHDRDGYQTSPSR